MTIDETEKNTGVLTLNVLAGAPVASYENLKNYIATRQLSYLWSFQGDSYFETQTGKIISLSQIEREMS